jgi:hypothetical protein
MFWIIQTMIRRHESKMAGYAFGSNPPYPRFLKQLRFSISGKNSLFSL